MDVEAIGDAEVAAALVRADAAFDELIAAVTEWGPGTCDEAMGWVRAAERLGRRGHALALAVQDRIDRSGVHKGDGHASAKVMVRHGANLSRAEALRRQRAVRMGRDLPAVAAAHAEGRLGVPQVERIARVHANSRVADELALVDAEVARAAIVLPFDEFDAALADWERLTDEDGAGDRSAKAAAHRDHRMHRGFDGSWRTEGSSPGVAGQAVYDVWQRQVQREWERDWAEARARLGDAATAADLIRTDAQRRHDAHDACMLRGDLVDDDGNPVSVAARTVTDLVVDHVTFERAVARLFGCDPGPDPRLVTWWDDILAALAPQPAPTETAGEDPTAPAAEPSAVGGLVGFRCGTVDGDPLDPTEVAVATLIGQVRRVVTGADGVVLDMGRTVRCFTGARQLAVRLSHRSCVWTGCDVPSSECQCDHLESFNGPRQGRTDPGNGAPACGRHNRMKEQGYDVVRDASGRWHVFRPDGTEIT